MSLKFYPKAIKKNIAAGANDPEIVPVGVVLHVAVSNAPTLFSFFRDKSGGIESHLYLRKDGTFEQYRSLTREADAQYKGNSWVGPDGRRYGFLSIETQGMGGGRWNAKQLDALKEFLLWSSKEFGFPLKLAIVEQPAGVKQGGVGYHTLHSGWSNVPGKTCPGPRRIRQFKNVLLPWMREQRVPCLHCKRHCPKES